MWLYAFLSLMGSPSWLVQPARWKEYFNCWRNDQSDSAVEAKAAMTHAEAWISITLLTLQTATPHDTSSQQQCVVKNQPLSQSAHTHTYTEHVHTELISSAYCKTKKLTPPKKARVWSKANSSGGWEITDWSYFLPFADRKPILHSGFLCILLPAEPPGQSYRCKWSRGKRQSRFNSGKKRDQQTQNAVCLSIICLSRNLQYGKIKAA